MIAQNTILDSGVSIHTVSDDVLDSGAGAHAIFTATVTVNPIQIINFRLGDSLNRYFRL